MSDLLAIAKFLVIYIASSPFAKAFNMLIAAEGYIQAHNITVKKIIFHVTITRLSSAFAVQ